MEKKDWERQGEGVGVKERQGERERKWVGKRDRERERMGEKERLGEEERKWVKKRDRERERDNGKESERKIRKISLNILMILKKFNLLSSVYTGRLSLMTTCQA